MAVKKVEKSEEIIKEEVVSVKMDDIKEVKNLPSPNAVVDIYFAKTKDDVKIPCKSDGNAGYDIYANFDEDYIVIPPHTTKMIPTHLISAVSNDYYFQLFERGSTGSKGIAQRCGVIDASYRGEWFIPITNTNGDSLIIYKPHVDCNDVMGEIKHIDYPYEKAICQAILLPVPKTKVNKISVDEIMKFESSRMDGALGSTGK